MPVLSREDSRADSARDTDEGFQDWLNVSGASQTETDHAPTNQSDIALPAQPREIAFEGILRINGYAAGIIRSNEGLLIVDAGGEVDADISVHDATKYAACVVTFARSGMSNSADQPASSATSKR